MTGNELLEQLLYLQQHHPSLMEKQVFGKFRTKKTVDTVYKLLSPINVGKIKINYKTNQYGVQPITPNTLNELIRTSGFNQASINIQLDGEQSDIPIDEVNVLML